MVWVYDQYKYVDSYSAGIDFSRQKLTSTVKVVIVCGAIYLLW